mgnify:CR=1 FL=1
MIGRILLAAIAGTSLLFGTGVAYAEDLSTQQILENLKTSKTRSLSGLAKPAASAEDQKFLKRVTSQTRSLSVSERDQVAAIAASRPKVDLNISFEYNSAKLSASAEPQLNSLGKALSSSDLVGSVVMLGGHTDAKGSEGYNQELSERRAEAVKRFLVKNYKIAPESLISAGYGKKKMKNDADPYAPENRRVEIVNLADREEASR